MIPMEPVNSSNIEAAGFDESEGVLRVKFKSGSVYDYSGVDQQTYQAFLDAPSKGGYVARVLRPSTPAVMIEDGNSNMPEMPTDDNDE